MLNTLNDSHRLDRNQFIHAKNTERLLFSLQEAQTTSRGENRRSPHKQKREERQFPNSARGAGGKKERKKKRKKTLCKHRHLFHGFLEQRKPCTAHFRRAVCGWEHMAWHRLAQAAFCSQGRHHGPAVRKGYFQIQDHLRLGIPVLKLSTCSPEAFLPGLKQEFAKPTRFVAARGLNPPSMQLRELQMTEND